MLCSAPPPYGTEKVVFVNAFKFTLKSPKGLEMPPTDETGGFVFGVGGYLTIDEGKKQNQRFNSVPTSEPVAEAPALLSDMSRWQPAAIVPTRQRLLDRGLWRPRPACLDPPGRPAPSSPRSYIPRLFGQPPIWVLHFPRFHGCEPAPQI